MLKPIKVMIVDDHDIVIDGLKSILNPFGFAFPKTETEQEQAGISEKHPFQIVGVATSGENLLERVVALKELDVIVMDYYMQGLNGLDTALAAKKLRPTVKVILFSMEESSAVITEVFANNIEGYVTKVEGRQRLLEAIIKVHKGERVYPNLKLNAILPWMTKKTDQSIKSILSKREMEVACLIVHGNTTQQIADALNIAFNTVEVHRNNIYKKLDINRLADLVRYALENKLCV